ncbi:RPA-related protein RADX [Clarias gariepinus]
MAKQIPPEPGSGSGTGSGSELFGALEQLCGSRTLRFSPPTPLRAAVLALDRYLGDARAAPDGDGYSYDVTITDAEWRVKCVLAPGLNRLVRVNALRCGSCVLIARLSLVHDETRLRRSCVCIEEARSGSAEPDILQSVRDPEAVRWWTHEAVGSAPPALGDVPLQNGRKHYLSLWNNEDPHGAVWRPHAPPPDVAIDVSKISLLGDLEAFLVSSRRPVPLLVRVLHKSRLRYYGKPGQNINFPFQAYFEVADQSGVMSMVLWNELCPEWYQRLPVGSVLYLQNYSLKRSYQKRSRPQLGTLPLFFFSSTEICLNPRNPSADITVIPPKSVQPQWSLPEVTYNFITRQEVESLASNQACDVICLVTYVSRVERLRNRGNTVPEKFWTYRWVHAVDGTSDSPFILEVFASSQPEVFNSICPMAYLVCTHMRVCRGAGPSSGSGSTLYLTSSSETQLFITGCHRKQPYVSEPKVKAFIQWTKTLKDSAVLRKTSVGGYYCYPPPPPTFTPNTTSDSTTNDEGASPSLMAVGDLRRELGILQYRERKRVAVQGYITAVQYHRWPPEAPDTTPQHQHHVEEHDSMGVASGLASSVSSGAQGSATSQSDAKRRRVEQGVQKQYWTRAKQQLERQVKEADLGEDEDARRRTDEQDSEALSTPSPRPTESSETEGAVDTQQPPARPAASWESSVWPLVKQDVTDHVRLGPLERDSVSEKFRFDDRDVALRRINLSPAKWSPEQQSDADSEAHVPVNFPGYLTLTLLGMRDPSYARFFYHFYGDRLSVVFCPSGLNHQAALDIFFLPVFCAEDPRAVGTSHCVHDNTLTSCLSTGHVCAQADFSPEAFLSSASALEDERVVCLLDVCLLGENRLEIVCPKVYRTADIITPV